MDSFVFADYQDLNGSQLSYVRLLSTSERIVPMGSDVGFSLKVDNSVLFFFVPCSQLRMVVWPPARRPGTSTLSGVVIAYDESLVVYRHSVNLVVFFLLVGIFSSPVFILTFIDINMF